MVEFTPAWSAGRWLVAGLTDFCFSEEIKMSDRYTFTSGFCERFRFFRGSVPPVMERYTGIWYTRNRNGLKSALEKRY